MNASANLISSSPTLDAALAYAARGWAVIPCHPGSKKPLVQWKRYQTERPSHEQIREWWATWPDANVAALTGSISGLSVLDVDEKPWDNKHGKTALFALITTHGAVPTTPTQRTWSGGMQFLFAYAPRAAQGAGSYGPDLDGRNDGGYILVPPSVIEEGERDGTYAWTHDPETTPLAPMPSWLLDQLKGTTSEEPKAPTAAVAALKVGKGRNNALTSLAGSMRRRDMSEEAIYAGISAENEQRCDPPLPDSEVRSIARSMMRYAGAPAAPDGEEEMAGNLADGLRVASFASVEAENVEWLWDGFLPVGMLTLIGGDPEQGKSTITFDLAARVSTGAPWPDGTPGGAPERVLFLASEDSAAHTMKPRLDAAGADPRRVDWITSTVVQGKRKLFSLAHDLEALAAEHERQPFKLLIVDPLNAYLPAVDTYRDNEVRAVLTPLAEWAERRRVALIGIMHMGKNGDRTALQRMLGSTAFTAAARAAYLACRDVTDEGRRLFLNSKMSVAARPQGLAFQFLPCTVPGKDGGPVKTVRITWATERVTISANEALRQLSKTAPQVREEAKKFLRSVLGQGPVAAAQIEAQAKEADIAWRTVERAKLDLEVQPFKVGMEGGWHWAPPGWSMKDIGEWKAQRMLNEARQLPGGQVPQM